MEKYSRGRRGAPAKGVGRETAARVQIPPSPPSEQSLKIVKYLIRLSKKSRTNRGFFTYKFTKEKIWITKKLNQKSKKTK